MCAHKCVYTCVRMCACPCMCKRERKCNPVCSLLLPSREVAHQSLAHTHDCFPEGLAGGTSDGVGSVQHICVISRDHLHAYGQVGSEDA